MPKLEIGNKAKAAAAKKGASLIENGMVIGLGTGSTANLFVKELAHRCKNGLQIEAVATSYKSAELAREEGIPLIDVNSLTEIDIAVDGADEIDPAKQMIKGGGGALLREKIVASMAKEMIVLIDQKKWVDRLGAFPLPIEISPFAHPSTLEKLRQKGFRPMLRQMGDKAPYMTDNGNYIVDLYLEAIENAEELDSLLHMIPGVVETGLFLHMAGRVITGHEDGTTKVMR